MNTVKREAGNMLVIIAIAITALFALASFALNSSLSFLKRQELQTLAESVAMSAALNLPNRALAKEAAERWYDMLRLDENREIGADRNLVKGALEIKFRDNQKKVSDTEPYSVESIIVTVSYAYRPRFAVSKIWNEEITITGSAEASLRPSDVMLVVENSASLIDRGATASPTFNDLFGYKLGKIYSAQCFGPALGAYKTGLIKLYDSLSQSTSFRVGVMASNSRSGGPLVLAELGQTVISPKQLEYDGDLPDFHSTRCFAATGDADLGVPLSWNNYQGTWRSRANLRPLFGDDLRKGLKLEGEEPILVRDALWTLPAAYTSESGYIHPSKFYSSPADAIALARTQLQNTRRTDKRPVARRVILVATDDAGVLPPPWSDGEKSLIDICKNWTLEPDNIELGILYFGHNQSLFAHDYDSKTKAGSWIEALRKECLDSKRKNGVFFVEASPATEEKFKSFGSAAALLGYALKETELLR